MEFTRRSYAVVYVILLCALAQGGSEGKGGKDEEISIDGGGAFSSSIYVHGIKVFLSLLWNFSAGVLFVHDCAQDSFYSKKMFDGPF